MKYQGSCHCGRIAYEVEGEIKGAMDCNCSICQRKGWMMWFVPQNDFHLRTPEDAASTYTFNKHVIKHKFCPVCGISPYSEGADAEGRVMVAVNLRCLDDVDLNAVPVQHYDGRAL